MMKLTTESDEAVTIVSFDQVRTILAGLHQDGNCFAVLARDDGHFIQTEIGERGFVVEKQEGGLDRHFRASRNSSGELEQGDVERLFHAFFNREPMPAVIAWQRVEVKPTPTVVIWLLKLLPWAAGAALLFFLVRDVSGLLELLG